MTDSPQHARSPTANGHPTKLHKRPSNKTTPDASPTTPYRQAGRLHDLQRDPLPNVSDQLQPKVNVMERKSGHLTGIKQRISNRQSSGGFLVEKERRSKSRTSLESGASSKGKEREDVQTTQEDTEDLSPHTVHSRDSQPRSQTAAPGSFLSNDVGLGETNSRKRRRSVNFGDRLHSPNTRNPSNTEPRHKPSIRSSPFHTPPRSSMSTAPRPSSESPVIDPSQIVRMALNLSEGRKMHLDPGHVPSIPSSMDRRAVSASILAKGRHTSRGGGTDSFDRQRESKTNSSGRGTPSGRQSGVLSLSSRSSAAESSLLLVDQQPEYTFSPATVARAERAKAYFELANQHRRLLQYLPPLKHDVHREQSGTSGLGRDYNPIQFLRNREDRIFSRKVVDSGREGWTDPIMVQNWIDAVEREAKQDGYVEGDVAHLPRWIAGAGMSTNPQSEALRHAIETANQKTFIFSHSVWSMEPPDLLADAYWLEQSDHKKLIKSRTGNVIYKDFSRPTRRRAGTDISTKTFETRYTASSDEDTAVPNSRRGTDVSRPTADASLHTGHHTDDVRFSPQHKSKTAAVRRRFLRRRKDTLQNDDYPSSDESNRSIEGFPSRRGPKNTNIGPLERHMKEILEKEQAGETSVVDSSETQHGSPGSPESYRRGGFSEESPPLNHHENPGHHRKTPITSIGKFPDLHHHRRKSSDPPRISIDHADEDKRTPHANGKPKQPLAKPTELGEPVEVERIVGRGSRLGFLKRHKNQKRPATAETDFANGDTAHDERRKSTHSNSDADSLYHDANQGTGSVDVASSESLARDKKQYGERSPTTRHFFKAGRIGEIMRSEKPEPHLLEPPPSPHSRGYHSSDTDDTRSRDGRSESRRHAGSLKSSLDPRSFRRSSISSRHPQYHIQNLPSFKSSSASPEKERQSFLSPHQDHISRQQRQRRMQSKSSRFSDLAPPSIETSDVSPNTSSPDLTRTGTQASTVPDDKSRSHRSGYDSGSGSETASRTQSAATRLNNALRTPGGFARSGLPPTGLTALDPRRDPDRRGRKERREEESETPIAVQKPRGSGITRRDIQQVRTMLIAAGVKASTIIERANTPRPQLPAHIIKALQTAGKDPAEIGTLVRQREHVVAARHLSSQLQSSMSAFDKSAVSFRHETCQNLTGRIDDLRDLVANHLTHQVHEEGDRADGFVAQLTTTDTLSIKQLNDSVDMMLRKRRQRLRWMRKAGFSILEWVLVALMWAIWVVVFAISTTKRVIGFVIGIIRWMLFLD